MTDPLHIVAVSGLITDAAGRILLVKTPRRGWEMPGGQVEKGEDLFAALKREAREESGCEVRIEELVGVYSNLAPPEKVMLVFRGCHVCGEPRASDETLDAGWFSTDEALLIVTNPPDALKLKDALERRVRPVVRAYRTNPFQLVTAVEL